MVRHLVPDRIRHHFLQEEVEKKMFVKIKIMDQNHDTIAWLGVHSSKDMTAPTPEKIVKALKEAIDNSRDIYRDDNPLHQK